MYFKGATDPGIVFIKERKYITQKTNKYSCILIFYISYDVVVLQRFMDIQQYPKPLGIITKTLLYV